MIKMRVQDGDEYCTYSAVSFHIWQHRVFSKEANQKKNAFFHKIFATIIVDIIQLLLWPLFMAVCECIKPHRTIVYLNCYVVLLVVG